MRDRERERDGLKENATDREKQEKKIKRLNEGERETDKWKETAGEGGEIENKTVHEKNRVRERVSQTKERESWRNKKK